LRKSKVKPTSIRFDQETLSEIDKRCEDLRCSRNDYIKNAVDNQLELEDTEDADLEPTKPEPKILPGVVIKNIIFDCRDGNLYVDGKYYGKCADYEMNAGKIYDMRGNYLGQTRGSLKITVEDI